MKEYISLCKNVCNEIAHFTFTLTKLFVYAVENELYTLGEVGFQFFRPHASDEFATLPKHYFYFYFFFFVLLHVTQWIIPVPVPRLARSNRPTETTKRDIEETKRRDEWQIETRKWHEETAKLRIGGRDDWRKQRSDTKKRRNNEMTTRNEESNMLSTIWLHIYIQPWCLLQ